MKEILRTFILIIFYNAIISYRCGVSEWEDYAGKKQLEVSITSVFFSQRSETIGLDMMNGCIETIKGQCFCWTSDDATKEIIIAQHKVHRKKSSHCKAN